MSAAEGVAARWAPGKAGNSVSPVRAPPRTAEQICGQWAVCLHGKHCLHTAASVQGPVPGGSMELGEWASAMDWKGQSWKAGGSWQAGAGSLPLPTQGRLCSGLPGPWKC